jgi:hypothetical protein
MDFFLQIFKKPWQTSLSLNHVICHCCIFIPVPHTAFHCYVFFHILNGKIQSFVNLIPLCHAPFWIGQIFDVSFECFEAPFEWIHPLRMHQSTNEYLFFVRCSMRWTIMSKNVGATSLSNLTRISATSYKSCSLLFLLSPLHIVVGTSYLVA